MVDPASVAAAFLQSLLAARHVSSQPPSTRSQSRNSVDNEIIRSQPSSPRSQSRSSVDNEIIRSQPSSPRSQSRNSVDNEIIRHVESKKDDGKAMALIYILIGIFNIFVLPLIWGEIIGAIYIVPALLAFFGFSRRRSFLLPPLMLVAIADCAFVGLRLCLLFVAAIRGELFLFNYIVKLDPFCAVVAMIFSNDVIVFVIGIICDLFNLIFSAVYFTIAKDAYLQVRRELEDAANQTEEGADSERRSLLSYRPALECTWNERCGEGVAVVFIFIGIFNILMLPIAWGAVIGAIYIVPALLAYREIKHLRSARLIPFVITTFADCAFVVLRLCLLFVAGHKLFPFEYIVKIDPFCALAAMLFSNEGIIFVIGAVCGFPNLFFSIGFCSIFRDSYRIVKEEEPRFRRRSFSDDFEGGGYQFGEGYDYENTNNESGEGYDYENTNNQSGEGCDYENTNNQSGEGYDDENKGNQVQEDANNKRRFFGYRP